jgi:two-component system chemotaxis sensor kinase CheA
MQHKKYKYLLYGILVVVIIISFLLANILITLFSANQISVSSIILVLVNIIINFLLFFILFQLIQTINEKEEYIHELENEINNLKIPQKEEEIVEEKIFNPEEIAQQILPTSPQNLTLSEFCEKTLSNIAKIFQISTGIFYVKDSYDNSYKPCGTYAYYSQEPIEPVIEGEGLVGQAIKDRKPLLVSNIPQNYLRIVSGLGQSLPRHLYILPVLNKEEVVGAIELASFVPFDEKIIQSLDKLSNITGKIILKLKQ